VVGYLRPIKQWNDGKQAEYAMRCTYRHDSMDPGVGAAIVAEPQMATVVGKLQRESGAQEQIQAPDQAQSAVR
jgi:ribonucleoside-triphosphate reductase